MIDPVAVARGIDTLRLAEARWFAGKGRGVRGVRVVDAMPVPSLRDGFLLLVDVEQSDGDTERYLLPAFVSQAARVWEPAPGEGFWTAVVEAIGAGDRIGGLHGSFDMHPSPAFARVAGNLYGERDLGMDQSNTTIVLGERAALKVYRRLEPGRHPEIELGEALSARAGFTGVPTHAGSIVHVSERGERTAIAILQEFIPDAEDGWEAICGRLARAVDVEAATDEVVEVARIVAALHVTLARELGTTRATAEEQAGWRLAAERQLERALSLVGAEPGVELAAMAPRIHLELAALEHLPAPLLCRTHGDLHYAQVLRSPRGLHVVDFEGEPTRTIYERARPASPMRDVACMVLSLDHIGRTVQGRRHGRSGPEIDIERWIDRAIDRFTTTYSAELAAAGTELEFDAPLLRAFMFEKETYEYVYAARMLPSWLYAPRAGMARLLARAAT